MKLSELIERLQETAETYDGHDPEVMLQTQQNYPLRMTIRGIWAPLAVEHIELARIEECSGCGCNVTDVDGGLVPAYWSDETDSYSLCSRCKSEGHLTKEHGESDAEPIIYIVEGSSPYSINPYGTRAAWNEG